ncbi:MAG: hypothetical protein BAJATHORv1_60148 [Candidatus Thorarchaeota archaeon]|nr:MAG: hypothetical protein BAJATHORv1_60148 [Candidatus Thorarchaeota archaeon]
MTEISLDQARPFILDIQGLRTTTPCTSVSSVAKRIHNIQIDTISVVSRSHNLITFNRYLDYKDGKIWDYEREGELFEHWSHALCLMPMETYPFYKWRLQYYEDQLWSSYKKWGLKNRDFIEEVYLYVKENGPVKSSEYGTREKSGEGWWDWKAEKTAMEYLFYMGKLMVAYREGFQKAYDIAERVIPSSIYDRKLTDEAAEEFLIDTVLGCLGLASYKDFRSYVGKIPARKLWGTRQAQIEKHLEKFVESDYIVKVKIEGLDTSYYCLSENIYKLEKADSGSFENTPIKILTPFDNILRERHYPEEIWNFDYKIECYVPKKKRIYGYFVLPILDGCNLVGRLDAKVHRDKGLLEVKNLYFEDGLNVDSEFKHRVFEGLRQFMTFHSCTDISLPAIHNFNDLEF